MTKFLLDFVIISILAYVVYVKFFKKPKEETTKNTKPNEQFKKNGDSIMVSCEKCGTFTESIESIAVDGKFYCSKECAGVR